MKRCAICDRECRGTLCGLCWKSYKKDAFETGDLLEVVVWAAKRARYFAQRNPRAGLAPGQRRAQVARRKRATRRTPWVPDTEPEDTRARALAEGAMQDPEADRSDR